MTRCGALSAAVLCGRCLLRHVPATEVHSEDKAADTDGGSELQLVVLEACPQVVDDRQTPVNHQQGQTCPVSEGLGSGFMRRADCGLQSGVCFFLHLAPPTVFW